MDAISPVPFTFERVSLSPPGGKMSPGSIFGNRIALGPNQEEDIFWSTGTSLFRLSLGPAPLPPVAVRNYDGKLLLPAPNDRPGSSVAIGAQNDAKHSSEIQNIAVVSSDLLRLYSVDSMGQVLVNSFENDGNYTTAALSAPPSIGEHGWVGIAAQKALPTICATARYSDKLVTVYDQDRVVSKFRTISHPSQIRMLDNGMLVMTEQGSYSIYDLRLPNAPILPRYDVNGVGSSGNCVQRVYISPAPLYALDIMNTKVAVAGADRNCVVCDFRTGGVEARWNGCLKYDITRVNFSRSDPALCYVSGLDNELLVGRWDGTRGLPHFDGPHIESHWIGISNDNPSDTVFGLAQSGHVYICKNTPALLEGVNSPAKTSASSAAASSAPGAPAVIPHQRQKKKKTDPPPAKKPKLAEPSQ